MYIYRGNTFSYFAINMFCIDKNSSLFLLILDKQCIMFAVNVNEKRSMFI